MSGISGRLKVHITPRASKNEIAGWKDGVLSVRVTAPPIEGRANEALIKLLASALKIAPSRIAVVGGASSRNKLLAVEGWSSEELAGALGGVPGDLSRPWKAPG